MSGKKDKESRRLKKSLEKHVDKIYKHVKKEKETNMALFIQVYKAELLKLNFFKRFAYCWRLMWKIK